MSNDDIIATSNPDKKKVVTVITILFEPYYIGLAKDYFELQHLQRKEALKGDSSDRLNISRINTTYIKHVVFTLEDKANADLLSILPSALAAIDDALGAHEPEPTATQVSDDSPERICLVHCFKGMSRSVSVIIAYLLSRHPDRFKTFDEALCHVRNERPVACPNVGFALALRQFHKTLNNSD